MAGRRPSLTARFAALVLVLAAAGIGGFVVSTHLGRPAGASRGTGTASGVARATPGSQAAAWAAGQVDHHDIVSCDRVMCAALAADGFPQQNLRMLGAAPSYPRGSAVVVETPAVRGVFGSSLARNFAPVILAAYGSGDQRIDIRVMTPHGAAYLAALKANQLATAQSAVQMLAGTRLVMVSATARRQLDAGQIDSRLIFMLANLASSYPIDVLKFGNIAPGGNPHLPLRFADLAENGKPAHMPTAAYVHSIITLLRSQLAPERPSAIAAMRLPDGQPVLRIEFSAPSPLGQLAPQPGP